jgi:hypothetical protein
VQGKYPLAIKFHFINFKIPNKRRLLVGNWNLSGVWILGFGISTGSFTVGDKEHDLSLSSRRLTINFCS